MDGISGLGTGKEAEEPVPSASADEPNNRSEARKAVLKRAQAVFDGIGLDCIVENMSGGGARIRFGSPTILPDTLALRFNDGTSFAAERRWAHGSVVGLQFTGGGPVAEAERRHLITAVQDAASAADPAETIRLLRQSWYFGDEGLRRATEAFEVARARFMAALEPHLSSRQAAPPQHRER